MQADDIKLALAPDVLERLLAQKQLSVEDFRCLDTRAKSRIRRMLLNNVRVQLAPGKPAAS